MNFSKINKSDIIKAEYKRNKKHVSNLHHDFLALNPVSGYYETEKYYFFQCRMLGLKEVRYFKKSTRVSVSGRFTFLPSAIANKIKELKTP